MSHKSIKPLANRTYLVVGAAGNLGPIWCSKILEDGGKVVAIGLSSKSDPELLKLRDKVGENLVLVDQDISLPINSQLETIINETKISGVVLTQHLLEFSRVFIAHPLQVIFRASAYAIAIVFDAALNIGLQHFE